MAIAGFAEGGHAALWAAQLAPEWTPELEPLGTVVAAPTSDLAATSTAALSQPQFDTFPVAAAAGLAAADPAALVALLGALTPAGSQLLQHWDGHCFDDDAADLAGPYLVADPAVTEPFATLMARNTAGTTATAAPLLIFDSVQDTLVTAAQSDALLARLCAAGQVVERRTATDATHDSLRSSLRTDGVDWLTAIADGTVRPASACAAPSGLMSPARPEATTPTEPVEYAPGDRTFYAPPDPMPQGEHGDLVRWQVVEGGFGHRYRIMYLAETVAGAPTVATALVEAAPEAPPFGGWRTLLYGHGTTGLADICSPSRAVDDDIADGDVAMEIESIGHATSEGWVVVSADYEGLGGPGAHPLLVGVSEGRSLLDAGRAAHQIPGLYLGPTTAIAGFSQGGHAALWATQLAAEWTPEQEIVATVVGAPASEPAALASWSAAEGSVLAAGIVAGLAVAYPDAAANLGQVLTPNGIEVVRHWDTHCFADPVDVPPPYVAADPSTVEPFASLLAANTAGTTATATPLLILHGDADERVPLQHSEALLARLCAAGQVVERRVLPGGLHVGSSGALSLDGLAWLAGLADGTTTPISSCTP
jgi:dienelactone hydrolase